ncbi:Sulfatase [Roseimaritima multifibrata]|uniref:Sulfatase n=1 Tax=Roseimaritima multifibrata TaxID=1930274 RepID=A0A517M9A3_9BACT|nr:sulfatase-like hydrolase/transferase [Roseimaritima multifibrata]QDS91465.1 Sulfatase [Roseimaritima multifibrata]
MRHMTWFQRGIAEQARNFRVLFSLVALLSLGRITWMFCLQDYWSETGTAADVAIAMLQGLRMDAVVATYAVLPAMVMMVLFFQWKSAYRISTLYRNVVVVLFAVSYPPLWFGSLNYFQAFGETYNVRMFDILDGNLGLIYSIAVEEYGLLWKLPIGAVLSLGIAAGAVWLNGRPSKLADWCSFQCQDFRPRVAAVLLLGILTPMLLRGSPGPRPIMYRDACVTSQWCLNQAVLNPYFAIKCAWKERCAVKNNEFGKRFLVQQKSSESVAILAELTQASAASDHQMVPASSAFPSRLTQGPEVQGWEHPVLDRVAEGNPNGPPSHVFMLFLESYDAWPFLPQYHQLNLVPEGRRLAKAGLHVRRFLPAANTSVDSYIATIQGLHQTDKYQQKRLPTSMVTIMQDLGYQTRSINAFSGHTIVGDRMVTEQGFEKSYFTQDIKHGGETNHHTLHDQTLYNFIEKLDFNKPTFNVVYTQSYHAPYDMDLEAVDCVVPPYPPELRSDQNHDEASRRIAYGHLKYTDRCLGKFVDKMAKRFPRALFVITGDHFGRQPFTKDNRVYEHSAVPLILYGPKILKGKKFAENVVGGHCDITPTLTQLLAPQGYQYKSLGQDLFRRKKAFIAVGTDYVMFADGTVCLRDNGTFETFPWASAKVPETVCKQRIATARKLYNASHGLGYLFAKSDLPKAIPPVALAPTGDRITRLPLATRR